MPGNAGCGDRSTRDRPGQAAEARVTSRGWRNLVLSRIEAAEELVELLGREVGADVGCEQSQGRKGEV